MKYTQKKVIKTPPPPTVSPLTNVYKMNLVWGVAIILLSLAVYGAVALLVQLFYNPDISQAQTIAAKVLYNYSPLLCLPEPKEQMFFMSAVLTITLSIALFTILTEKIRKKGETRYVNILYPATLIIGLAALGLIVVKGFMNPNPFAGGFNNFMDSICNTNWQFYFKDTFLFSFLPVYASIIFPMILFLFFYPFKTTEKISRFIRISNQAFVYGFCSCIIIVVFLITAFEFPYTGYNKYNFNAVYYSVVQVYNGLPLLVDNFMNTYGLYPHFVVPIMKLSGGTIISFTIIMAFLLAVCFIFLLYVLRQTVDNVFLILFGFCGIFFIGYMYQRLVLPYDSAFCIYPIRWIFPFGLIFFGSIYLKFKTEWMYYLSFFFFAIGFLWNPDFGMLTYAALVIFYIYLELESKVVFTLGRQGRRIPFE